MGKRVKTLTLSAMLDLRKMVPSALALTSGVDRIHVWRLLNGTRQPSTAVAHTLAKTLDADAVISGGVIRYAPHTHRPKTDAEYWSPFERVERIRDRVRFTRGHRTAFSAIGELDADDREAITVVYTRCKACHLSPYLRALMRLARKGNA